MMGTLSNGSQASRVESISDIEVVSKPKRRRFPAAEKSRILREADACVSGTIGECLRREGIYSSQLYAWRRERAQGDLDPKTLKNRAAKRLAEQESERRIHELEVENRKLHRQIARFELFEEIRKKAAGLLNLEYKSPEFDEND